MKKVVFTICAKNYIGLAQVLGDSLKTNNPEIDFYIFVADEFENESLQIEPNILIARHNLNISEDQWINMSFKYEITEFCTSIKPFCFSYMFNELNYEECIYFDPDIMVFSSINSIYDTLNNATFVLTPHINTMEVQYSGTWEERKLMYSGIYNLGFIAIKNNEISNRMLNWWEERLKDRCFQNLMENYFTDQKWIDFLPGFFPNEVFISNDPGLNLAPWNFHERKIIQNNGNLYVENRVNAKYNKLENLKFVHFSGFNYKDLLKNNNVNHKNIENFSLFPDLIILFDLYVDNIRKSNMLKYIDLTYSYNYFTNKNIITNIHRKFYRRLSEDNKAVSNPFNADGDFYKTLKRFKLVNTINVTGDKINISNVQNLNNKVKLINLFFKLIFFIVGPSIYFTLARTLRLYSIIENHVFIIDKDYLKNPKLRN